MIFIQIEPQDFRLLIEIFTGKFKKLNRFDRSSTDTVKYTKNMRYGFEPNISKSHQTDV